MQPPATRIRIAEPDVTSDDVAEVSKAVSSGWISGRGKFVKQFEDDFGKWLGEPHVVSCSSGTAALHLALESLGIKRGDKVLIPAFSMGAIPFALSYVGAEMELVDSEDESWNMDPSKSAQLARNCKATIVMHTYGHPVNMGQIQEECNLSGSFLIEDAAEAHGAEYDGKKVGSIGDVSCFSFFANKIVTTGEGGAVTTSEEKYANLARILRDMAFSQNPSKKFLHEYVGHNYRMTNMSAALGISQMKRIESYIETRRRNAALYNTLLSGTPGITTPPEAKWAKNVYWMYSILVGEEFGMTRDELMQRLDQDGIETRPFFVPVHQQPVFAQQFKNKEFPVAERLSREGLNLPSGNTLTEEQVRHIGSVIASYSKR